MKRSLDDKIFKAVVVVLILLLAAACIIPFLNLFAISVSEPGPVARGEVILWPKGFTLQVYQAILENGSLLKAMGRTLVVTAVFVVLAMIITIMCAYPLSEPELKGRKIIWLFILFTMYFSGGMIPSYLLMSKLKLIDSLWVLILPGMLSTYNMIIMRSFFASIPVSLKESAFLDGANDCAILMKIVLPLSKPALATIALFYAVSRWNGMSDALIYINSPSKAVLQIKLKSMIESAEAITDIMEGAAIGSQTMVLETVRAGCLLFSMVPIMIIYPFLQKYFVKGVMIGAVKG